MVLVLAGVSHDPFPWEAERGGNDDITEFRGIDYPIEIQYHCVCCRSQEKPAQGSSERGYIHSTSDTQLSEYYTHNHCLYKEYRAH